MQNDPIWPTRMLLCFGIEPTTLRGSIQIVWRQGYIGGSAYGGVTLSSTFWAQTSWPSFEISVRICMPISSVVKCKICEVLSLSVLLS
jgi:hypothetical protein